jgi:hypothetical protein
MAFFNAPERGSVTGNFAMAPGATRADTLEMMREMQRATESLGARIRGRARAQPARLRDGRDRRQRRARAVGRRHQGPDQLGGISIELIDADLRPYSSFPSSASLQERVQRTRWSKRQLPRLAARAGGRRARRAVLRRRCADTLKGGSEALKTALAQFPRCRRSRTTWPMTRRS